MVSAGRPGYHSPVRDTTLKLTVTWLDRLKPPAKQTWYTEDGRPGFMLRAFPTGEKSFVYRYQIAGVRRMLKLGSYPAVSLADAHKRYDVDSAHVAEGRDPAQVRHTEKVALSDAPTVQDVVTEWMTLYCEPERKRPEQAKTLIKNLTEPFLRLKAKDVTKRVAIDMVLDPILRRGSRTVATDVGSLLKQIFAYAEDRERIPGSMLGTLKKHGGKEKKRKRVLNDEEVVIFWHKLDLCGMQEFMRIALRLTLVTGQRRGEIATMRWSHIDFANNIWSVPGDIAKNEEPNLVPLSPLALRLLAQLKVFAKDSPFVLPSYHRKKKVFESITVRALTRAISENEEVFGIPHFRPHDLRRTCRTNLSRLKVPREVAELIINHKKKGDVEVYDLYEFLDEKKDALEKWGALVEALTALKAPAVT
jgi:integrase